MKKLRLLLGLPIALAAGLILGPLATAYADCVGGPGDDVLSCDQDTSWVAGDNVSDQDGGNDQITVTDEADIAGWVVGDGILDEDANGAAGNGGDDTIVIDGTVSPGGDGYGGVNGDDISCQGGCSTTGDGGNDSITINGTVNVDVRGDAISNGQGGDDTITVNGTLNGYDPSWCGEGGDEACGQWAIMGDSANGNGGSDTINIDGEVTGMVSGDYVSGDGSVGGADVFNVTGSLTGADPMYCDGPCGFLVAIEGDTATGGGGNDIFNISGTVQGNVLGDDAFGAGASGGDDVFNISGTVQGNVLGDDSNGDGGDDVFNISGDSVTGNVWGDGNWGEGAQGGDDTFNIDGTVGGDLLGDTPSGEAAEDYQGGDDTVNLMDGAVFSDEDHIIDGNGHESGDTLVFAFTTSDPDEVTVWQAAVAAITNALDWQEGDAGDAPTLTFRGQTYRWQNFEVVSDLFELISDGNGQAGAIGDGTGPSLDCGPNPYLDQRPFNAACQPLTGDPNESALHGLTYSEAVALGLVLAP